MVSIFSYKNIFLRNCRLPFIAKHKIFPYAAIFENWTDEAFIPSCSMTTPRLSVNSASDECIFRHRNSMFEQYHSSNYRDPYRRLSTPDMRYPHQAPSPHYDPLGHRYSLSLSQDDILSNDQLQQIRFDPRYRDCRSFSNISLSSNSNKSRSNTSVNSFNSGPLAGSQGKLPQPKRWDTNPSIYIEEYVDQPPTNDQVSVGSGSGSGHSGGSIDYIVQPLDEMCIKSVSSAEDIPFIDEDSELRNDHKQDPTCNRHNSQPVCRKTVSFEVLSPDNSNRGTKFNKKVNINNNNNNNITCDSNVVTVSNRCDFKDPNTNCIVIDEVSFTSNGAARVESVTEILQPNRSSSDCKTIWKNKFSTVKNPDADIVSEEKRYRRSKSRSSPNLYFPDSIPEPTPLELRQQCHRYCRPHKDIIHRAHANLCCCSSLLPVTCNCDSCYVKCKNLHDIYQKLDKTDKTLLQSKKRNKDEPIRRGPDPTLKQKSKSMINISGNPIVYRDIVPLGNINDLILKRFPDAYLFKKTKQCKPNCTGLNAKNIKLSDMAYEIRDIDEEIVKPSTSKNITEVVVHNQNDSGGEQLHHSQSSYSAQSTSSSTGLTGGEQVMEGFSMKKKRKSLSEKISEVLRRNKQTKKDHR